MLVLGAAACGGGGREEAIGVDALAQMAGADAPQPVAGGGDRTNDDLSMINASTGEMPDIAMIDVSSGATVNLQSLVGDDKPLLFWFWAPH